LTGDDEGEDETVCITFEFELLVELGKRFNEVAVNFVLLLTAVGNIELKPFFELLLFTFELEKSRIG
jgi:hypothetical protein